MSIHDLWLLHIIGLYIIYDYYILLYLKKYLFDYIFMSRVREWLILKKKKHIFVYTGNAVNTVNGKLKQWFCLLICVRVIVGNLGLYRI